MEQYKDLAHYFLVDCEDYHVATYYYYKCMSLAEKRKDNIELALAKKGFSKCNMFFDQASEAIMNLEEAMVLAKDHDETLKKVSKELIEIYKTMAHKCENNVINPEEQANALYYYEKCLEVCQQADDTESEGQIASKIGHIYFNRGEYKKAIEKHQVYLDIAQKMSDVGVV